MISYIRKMSIQKKNFIVIFCIDNKIGLNYNCYTSICINIIYFKTAVIYIIVKTLVCYVL